MELVTESNYRAIVLESEKPVLVEFSASWCGPCKAMEPILEEVEQLYADRVKFCKIYAEQNPKLAQALEIHGLPALVLVKQGNVLGISCGYVNKARLIGLIDELLD